MRRWIVCPDGQNGSWKIRENMVDQHHALVYECWFCRYALKYECVSGNEWAYICEVMGSLIVSVLSQLCRTSTRQIFLIRAREQYVLHFTIWFSMLTFRGFVQQNPPSVKTLKTEKELKVT